MELPSFGTTAVVAAAIGVASHLAYFIHGEHHKYSHRYLAVFALSPAILFISLLRLTDNTPTSVLVITTAIATFSYFTALISSIFTYRIFFHPLRKFPGPFSYRFSKLVQVANIAKDSQNYLQAEELRKQYGNIVRVGPNELTIFTPEGLTAIAGAGTKCTKAAWYDGAGMPFATLHTTRDRIAHDKRRKTWDRGFSAKALRDYESRVIRYSDELMDQMKAYSGKPLNASLWLNFYSFDVMGDLAFGQSFDMLRSGEKHHALKLLAEGMDPLGIFTPIPWLFPILYNIPGLGAGLKEFRAFGDAQVAARRMREPEQPDILSWLIDAEKNSTDPINSDSRWMTGDARLIIVAGSDTTAATLTFAMYHLAKNPKIVTKLREELKSLNYLPGADTEVHDIQDAKYLNGIIHEALRLHPAVPSGVLRLTPPEGIDIQGTYIPGGVTISSPLHSMGRLESCFTHGQEFIPERWGDKPELIKNKAAFAPFGGGVYSCVGRQLALMELRSVIARTVTQFDVGFAPGEDGTTLLTKTRDVFTLDLAPLNLIFTERKS